MQRHWRCCSSTGVVMSTILSIAAGKGIAVRRGAFMPIGRVGSASIACAENPVSLDSDNTLQKPMAEFHRKNCRAPVRGEKLSDDALAQEPLDTAVNMGVRRAVRFSGGTESAQPQPDEP